MAGEKTITQQLVIQLGSDKKRHRIIRQRGIAGQISTESGFLYKKDMSAAVKSKLDALVKAINDMKIDKKGNLK